MTSSESTKVTHLPLHMRRPWLRAALTPPFGQYVYMILLSFFANCLHIRDVSSVEPSSMMISSKSLNYDVVMLSIHSLIVFSLLYTGTTIDSVGSWLFMALYVYVEYYDLLCVPYGICMSVQHQTALDD